MTNLPELRNNGEKDMGGSFVRQLIGIIARKDLMKLGTELANLVGMNNTKRRIDIMEQRLRKSLWEYAVSHGKCGTQNQIIAKGIYPKLGDSTAIQNAFNWVMETQRVFRDTGEISKSDLIAMSKAILHIEQHLEKSKGNSQLPAALERIRKVEAGPSLTYTLLSFLVLLAFGIFFAWLGYARSSKYLMGYGVFAVLVSVVLLIDYWKNRSRRGLHLISGFWAAAKFFLLIVCGVGLIWIGWTFNSDRLKKNQNIYMETHMNNSDIVHTSQYMSTGVLDFHGIRISIYQNPIELKSDRESLKFLTNKQVPSSFNQTLKDHETILLEGYDRLSLNEFESYYLMFLGVAAIVYGFFQPRNFLKQKKLYTLQAQKEIEIAEEAAKSAASEPPMTRPRDIV